MWPTPTRQDFKKRGPNSRQQGLADVQDSKCGQLNPEWVELLMGWPLGWTSLIPLNRLEYEKWLMGFRNENMFNLRKSIGAEEVQRQAGRSGSLQTEKPLQSNMRKHTDGPDTRGLAVEGETVQEKELRVMRDKKQTASSSCGQKHKKSGSEEPTNPVCVVPQVPSRYGKKAWADGSFEIYIPRLVEAITVPHRVDRVKALGNGQVSAVAASAWERLKK